MKNANQKALRIGLIGAGNICRHKILPALQADPEWEIAAVCDPNQEALQAIQALANIPKCHTDTQDFFRAGIDAAYVATPNSTHAEHVIRALEAGIPVLVEKPCAANVAEAEAMVAAAQKAALPVLVGYMSKLNRFNMTAHRLFAEARIGRARAFTSSFGFISSDEGWRFEKARGGFGVMADLMIYQIATIHDWFGIQPASCSAWGWPARDARLAPRTVMARLDLANGLSAHCDASFDRESCHYTVIGEEGVMEVSGTWYQSGTGRVSLWTKGRRENFSAEEIDPYAAELAHFRQVIRGKAEAGVFSLDRAVADLKVLESLARSADHDGAPLHC